MIVTHRKGAICWFLSSSLIVGILMGKEENQDKEQRTSEPRAFLDHCSGAIRWGYLQEPQRIQWGPLRRNYSPMGLKPVAHLLPL